MWTVEVTDQYHIVAGASFAGFQIITGHKREKPPTLRVVWLRDTFGKKNSAADLEVASKMTRLTDSGVLNTLAILS